MTNINTITDADRYRWCRMAWLEGAEDGTDPVQLQAIQAVYNEAEMDAAIDAELQRPENAHLLQAARAGDGKLPPLPTPAEFFVFAGLDWHRATSSYFAQMNGQTNTLALYTADQMRAYALAARGDRHLPEAVAQIVSSGPANFPILQWLSADHSFRAPIGSYLYAAPLTLETAEEAKKDRAHAEAYFRQAEQLLTGNEATLLAECDRLRGNLKSVWAKAQAAAERHGFRLVMQMPQEHVELFAAAPAAAPAWQPIETAPKDGRVLLLGYFNIAGKWRTLRGEWMSADYIAENWENPDDGEPGWYETSVENDDVPNCWRTRPTHWMPTPAGPAFQAPATAEGGQP